MLIFRRACSSVCGFSDADFQKLNVLLSASLLHYHWCVHFCNLGQDLQILDAKYVDEEISWQLEIMMESSRLVNVI